MTPLVRHAVSARVLFWCCSDRCLTKCVDFGCEDWLLSLDVGMLRERSLTP